MAIQRMQGGERKSAEMALFCHQPQVAESIYLQAGKIFRAIELHVQLFNWEKWKQWSIPLEKSHKILHDFEMFLKISGQFSQDLTKS